MYKLSKDTTMKKNGLDLAAEDLFSFGSVRFSVFSNLFDIVQD